MKRYIFVLLFHTLFVTAQEKVNVLEEVIVIAQQPPKYEIKKELKGKKYLTQLASRNISVVSTYHQKNTMNLVGMKFWCDASDLKMEEEIIFARPLLLSETMEIMLYSPQSFPLNNNTKEIIFSFSSNPIQLEENKTYFIGFEILDKNNTNKTIKVRALNKKKSYSLLKMNNSTDWIRQDNTPHGYSLDYELYFIK